MLQVCLLAAFVETDLLTPTIVSGAVYIHGNWTDWCTWFICGTGWAVSCLKLGDGPKRWNSIYSERKALYSRLCNNYSGKFCSDSVPVRWPRNDQRNSDEILTCTWPYDSPFFKVYAARSLALAEPLNVSSDTTFMLAGKWFWSGWDETLDMYWHSQ